MTDRETPYDLFPLRCLEEAALSLRLATDSYPHEHANTAVGATFVGRRVKQQAPSSKLQETRRCRSAKRSYQVIVGAIRDKLFRLRASERLEGNEMGIRESFKIRPNNAK